MENKFTKGEWKYNDGLKGKYFPHVCIPSIRSNGLPDETDYLTVNCGGWNIETHQANAKLIAAAPDMLAALKEYVDHCERTETRKFNNSFYTQMKAAIQKATS